MFYLYFHFTYLFILVFMSTTNTTFYLFINSFLAVQKNEIIWQHYVLDICPIYFVWTLRIKSSPINIIETKLTVQSIRINLFQNYFLNINKSPASLNQFVSLYGIRLLCVKKNLFFPSRSTAMAPERRMVQR